MSPANFEPTAPVGQTESTSKFRFWGNVFLPLILLGLLIIVFLAIGPLGVFKAALPPIEEVSIQRIILQPNEITLKVVNDGPDPVTIAQVLVNESYWKFEMEPSQTLPRLGRGTIKIYYPWVEGNLEKIKLLSRNGITFDAEIPVATTSPSLNLQYLSSFALLGVYVGVIPVFLGLLWLPSLRRLKEKWYSFFLALTVGLLVFLGIESLVEAIETIEKAPAVYQGMGVLMLGFFIAVLVLSAFSRKGSLASQEKGESHRKLMLAYSVALGIGIHNLGEGLAIGGAYAVGEISLGALLVLGFMIHNVTEGVAIVAPIAKAGARLKQLVLMGLLAGVPTILGTWIGGFTYSAIWSVLFLAIGAGAIFQVVFSIMQYMAKPNWGSLFSFTNVWGFLLGLAVMYVTGFFVTV